MNFFIQDTNDPSYEGKAITGDDSSSGPINNRITVCFVLRHSANLCATFLNRLAYASQHFSVQRGRGGERINKDPV